MEQKSKIGILVSFVVFMALVVILSSVSGRLWGEKPGKASPRRELAFQEKMTVSEFGKTNQLPNTVLKEVFGLGGLAREMPKKVMSAIS